MRYNAKRDANEKELIEFLKHFGSVVQVNEEGIPDLIFGVGSVLNILFEVKGIHGRLTPAQTRFFESWQGPAFVIRSISDIKSILTRYRFIREFECPCGKVHGVFHLLDSYDSLTCNKCGSVLQYNKIVGYMETEN